MIQHFRLPRFLPVFFWGLLPLLVTVVPAAHAQRAGNGPPVSDPFERRVGPTRELLASRYRSHEYHDNILTIHAADGSTRRIRSWATGVVKVEYFAPHHLLRPDSSVSVVQPPQPRVLGEGRCCIGCDGPRTDEGDGPNFCAGIIVRPTYLAYINDCQSVIIDKKSLSVRIVEHWGDYPFHPDTVAAQVAITLRQSTTAPGGTTVRFRLAPGERLYGTGSRALPVNRRGYRLELYNQAHYGSQNNEPNLNITLPTVLSSLGYMLFFDNHAPGYLDLGKTDKNVLEYGGEGLTSLSYFVITGRNQAEILDRYTALTGRQPLPPRWALGLIQSRFGYKSEAEMQQVATRMRRENFPLDALVLDLYWFGGTKKQGDLSWDKTNFPDPAGMMSSLNKQGVKTILISEPYVMRTSRNDSTVRTRGLVGTTAAGRPFTVGSFWAGPASILDVFKPATRNWLWGYYRTLHQQGAAGWWSDLGEPENHPAAMQHIAGPARAVHNAYGQSWAGIFTEGYAKDFPEERIFNLARSGWAGLQRNSVFPWSGDINRSWSGFRAQVPVMLGMGQGGVGYMHSDAGGFCVGGIDPELYTRWLQMASLSPILRPHGADVPTEPYYYPDPYKSSVRAAVQLRYQLLPYLYTLAWLNTTTGAPLVRSMDYEKVDSLAQLPGFQAYWPPETEHTDEYMPGGTQVPYGGVDDWQAEKKAKKAVRRPVKTITVDEEIINDLNSRYHFKSDLALANSNDQYMLGPNLLVAPVLEPGQRRRNVALPIGWWIDFYTNQTYLGGRTVGLPAPLAHVPLLVKAGAFLPMTAYRPSTALYRPDTLILRYYPDYWVSTSDFILYDDDGRSAQSLAHQQYETITMRGRYHPDRTEVTLSSHGTYPGRPQTRLVQLLVQRVLVPPSSVLFNGHPAPADAFAFDPLKHELALRVQLKDSVVVSLTSLYLKAELTGNTDPETLTLEVPGNRSFGPSGTTLHYTRHKASRAEGSLALRIRNVQGSVVRTLPLEATPGPHALPWDGRDDARQPVPPGVYTAETAGQHQRLIVTR